MSATATSLTQRERELAAIISAYDQVTIQLKDSHEALSGEVRKLRVELEDKNRELARRERLSALGEMATGVAHEIRNPLGSIQLYASLLDRDLNALPEAQRLVRKISAGVQALENIVGGVLDFAGCHQPDAQTAMLEAIVTTALEGAAAKARAKDIDLVMDGSLRDLTVCVDKGQMARAILNIVLNAIDAMLIGGTVRVAANCKSRETVSVTIRDDGPGIEEQIRDRIFNPFFTTKDDGTGLGLAIVHRIMESHGGHVSVCDEVSGGACFTLELPTRSKRTMPGRSKGVA